MQLSLNRKQERLLEGFRHPAQKACGVRTINQAMVVRERERQNQTRLKLSSDPFRFHAGTREAENRDFRMIHDGCKGCAPDTAEVGNGESAAFHISESYFFLAGFLRDLRE